MMPLKKNEKGMPRIIKLTLGLLFVACVLLITNWRGSSKCFRGNIKVKQQADGNSNTPNDVSGNSQLPVTPNRWGTANEQVDTLTLEILEQMADCWTEAADEDSKSKLTESAQKACKKSKKADTN